MTSTTPSDSEKLEPQGMTEDERRWGDSDVARAAELRRRAAALTTQPVPAAHHTMTLTLTDKEMAALDALAAKKDLSPPNVFRGSFRLYQAVEMGMASVTWHETGPLGLPHTIDLREQPVPVDASAANRIPRAMTPSNRLVTAPEGWIEWSGGENPVPGRMVEWRTADGWVSDPFVPDATDWREGVQDDYLEWRLPIAYRLVTAAEDRGGGDEPMANEALALAKQLLRVDYETDDFPLVLFGGRLVHIDNVFKYASDEIERLNALVFRLTEEAK